MAAEVALLVFLTWLPSTRWALDDLRVLASVMVSRALKAGAAKAALKVGGRLFGLTGFAEGIKTVWPHRWNPARLLHIATWNSWPVHQFAGPLLLGTYKDEMQAKPAQFWKESREDVSGANVREGPVEIPVSLPGGSGWEMCDDGEFPLLKAAFAGNRDEVLRLLHRGADVNMKTKSTKITAAMPCIYKRHPLILCDLAAYGADLFTTDDEGYTVFHYAVKRDFEPELALAMELCGRNLPERLVKELVLYSVARRSVECLKRLLPLATPLFLDRVREDMSILPISPGNDRIREVLGLPFRPIPLSTPAFSTTFDGLDSSIPPEPEPSRFRFDVNCELLRWQRARAKQLTVATTHETGVAVRQKKVEKKPWQFRRLQCFRAADENVERRTVLSWVAAQGFSQVLWLDCYALALVHGGTIEELGTALNKVLYSTREWVHLRGFEALFLGFCEPDEDSVDLDVHINNHGNVSFGVVSERFLRRRTCGGEVVDFHHEPAKPNLFVELARAGHCWFGKSD